MAGIASSWNNLKLLDELSGQKTVIHGIHPLAKVCTTFFFLVTVVSFDKYEITGFLPFFLYPVVVISLGDLPAKALIKRVLIAIPFALGVGIFNPIFDHSPMQVWGIVTVSGGWVSFTSILIRFSLTVLGALLLVATSGMGKIAAVLVQLRVPKIFVMQILFMYRYISVLMEEVSRVLRAHALRSLEDKGIRFPVWGSLLGQLFLRTIDRAERIYQAMLCRGFTGAFPIVGQERFVLKDGIYMIGWGIFFLCARVYNIPEMIGTLVVR